MFYACSYDTSFGRMNCETFAFSKACNLQSCKKNSASSTLTLGDEAVEDAADRIATSSSPSDRRAVSWGVKVRHELWPLCTVYTFALCEVVT
jgi:hypothetical protein